MLHKLLIKTCVLDETGNLLGKEHILKNIQKKLENLSLVFQRSKQGG